MPMWKRRGKRGARIYGSSAKVKMAAGDKREGVSGQGKGQWGERMKIDFSGGWDESGQSGRKGVEDKEEVKMKVVE